MNISTTSPCSIAVIGYGYWSPKLIRNIHTTDRGTVRLICEKNVDRHEQIKEENPGIEVVQHYREVFARPDIDAVCIVTIPSSHFRIAKQALDAGKHVLVEKPMTLRPHEAQLLVMIAQKRGLILMVDHTYLYTPAIQMLKQYVAPERMGTVYSFDSVRINLGLFQKDTNVLWDLAPHDISILLYLFDERPHKVSVIGSKNVIHPKQEEGQESIAHLMLFYKTFTAHVEVSWISPIKIRQITVIGSENTVRYDQLEERPLTLFNQGVYPKQEQGESGPLFEYKTGSSESIDLPQGGEDIARMLDDFLSAVNDSHTPRANAELGLAVVQILSAANRSLKLQGKHIPISYATHPSVCMAIYAWYLRLRYKY